MSLNPRAIATQGVGYSPRLKAVQGLWPELKLTPVFERRRVKAQAQDINEDDALLLIAAGVAVSYGRLVN